MTSKKILIGAHVSMANGLHLAFSRAESIGGTALQLFTKSSHALFGKPLEKETIALFKKEKSHSTIKSVIAHAGYLINLCSKEEKTAKISLTALEHEIDRCAQLDIHFLVLHPGAHKGTGETVGLDKIAAQLSTALEKTPSSVTILLETMGGQGTTLGNTFEQLRYIYDKCLHKNRIGICLDTCHLFVSGYDIRSAELYEKVIHHFDKVIGLDLLKTIHLNNTKEKFNAHIDRHSPINDGNIPLEIFKLFINDSRLLHIPKILETPTDENMLLWKKEITLLKELAT
jgi:deoxyribonuclease-4